MLAVTPCSGISQRTLVIKMKNTPASSDPSSPAGISNGSVRSRRSEPQQNKFTHVNVKSEGNSGPGGNQIIRYLNCFNLFDQHYQCRHVLRGSWGDDELGRSVDC